MQPDLTRSFLFTISQNLSNFLHWKIATVWRYWDLQPVPGLPEDESTVLTSNMDVVRTWCTMQWCCDARFALDVISYPVVVTLELINQRTLSWVRSRCSCWMWGCHVNKVTLRQSIYVNKIHHMITHSLPTQIIFMTLWQGHHSN